LHAVFRHLVKSVGWLLSVKLSFCCRRLRKRQVTLR